MRRASFFLTLVLAPLTALAQGTARPDTAKLTFNWPASVSARVEAQRYRERVSNGKHDTSDVRLSYRMTAQRRGNEYIVRFADFQLPKAARGARAGQAAAFAERIGGIVPSYRVNAAGEFAGLESPGVIRAFIDSMLTSMSAKD